MQLMPCPEAITNVSNERPCAMDRSSEAFEISVRKWGKAKTAHVSGSFFINGSNPAITFHKPKLIQS
jgi:hypothetical protein